MTVEDTRPRRLGAVDPAQADCLALIRRSFAGMEGRIDPPSSMYQLTQDGVAAQCQTGEVWVIGSPAQACVFLSQKGENLYLGKLAVDSRFRGQGFARRLVELAASRAQLRGLQALEVEVRIELVENHALFHQLGFRITGYGRHDGYDKPTFLTMRRPLA